MNSVIPFKGSSESKKKQVEQMFDQISGRYDFMNHFLSMGIDRIWRRKAMKILASHKPARILDVATGTADFAISALETGATEITGVDISEGMLNAGREKVKKYGDRIRLLKGDSEKLLFDDNTFDAVTVAFGVRNFEDLQKGLQEMRRVLKPGGRLMVLEFSRPKRFPVKQLFAFYFHYILPFWGKLLAKHETAYTYLPQSVEVFPEGNSFLNELKIAGFTQTICKPLTFGISSIYTAGK